MSEPQVTDANTQPQGQEAETKPEASAEATALYGDKGEAEQTQPDEQQSTTEEKSDPTRGAPEKYDFARPKSLDESVQLDAETLASFAEAAKELDLSQDAAQGLVDKVLPKMIERSLEQHAAQVEGWIEAARTDKEYGGDNLEANLEVAKAAIKKLGTPALQELLDSQLGLGNHPEVVRFMYRVGKLVSEDGQTPGGAQGGTSEDPTDEAVIARKMYPNTPQ